VARLVWHVNTTERGGGVAETLAALLATPDAGPPHRRFITSADPDVFGATKRIHYRLHGLARGQLPTPAEHATYRGWAHRNAERLIEAARPGDLVVLHDPQTAPMAEPLLAAGLRVAWRCHIGTCTPNETSRSTWRYLLDFLPPQLPLVFSDPALVPEEVAGRPLEIIAPSIDPDAAKNAALDPAVADDLLARAGLAPVPANPDPEPIVLQVSRWDPLKDMTGVLRAFAGSELAERARLVLCGPAPESIVDDPEAAEILSEVTGVRAELPADIARRVHLVRPVLANTEGNSLLVNALQRRADVVVQKSLQEGFGLTVTEAMWKGRPVVATRVGGIPSQITHGRTGLLLDDPHDSAGFVALVTRLLDRPKEAAELGRAAHERVAERFTVAREAADYQRLYRRMAGEAP
jgi:trehalose synthase